MAGTPRKRGNKESASRDLDSLEFVVPVVGARFTAAAAASGDVSGGARSWRGGTVRLLRMAAPGLLQIATVSYGSDVSRHPGRTVNEIPSAPHAGVQRPRKPPDGELELGGGEEEQTHHAKTRAPTAAVFSICSAQLRILQFSIPDATSRALSI